MSMLVSGSALQKVLCLWWKQYPQEAAFVYWWLSSDPIARRVRARATSVSTGHHGGALALSEHLPQCARVPADVSPVCDCPVESNELGCVADPHAGSCSGFEHTG